ncbi:hypothetical protein DVY02_01700 [Enterococcus faecium]|nr:hypothetical protein DVW90_01240 [Enterococcus faecium]TKN86755.1 hypothetical protein DVX12_01700 [Enterococcus faecium]TKO47446.1 hypothetical protein DVY02_01700 [Enterococcus faecium]
MFLSLKTLYRKRTVIWPFYFYTIIRTLSKINDTICNIKKHEVVYEFEKNFFCKNIYSLCIC